jgi:hypothetical protein
MRANTVSSTLAAAGLIAVLCLSWPHPAAGQGYTGQVRLNTGEVINLGDRHSPIPEQGVQVCDYWGKDVQAQPDGGWRIAHVRGPVVTKRPNQQATIVSMPDNYDTQPGTLQRLNDQVPMTWLKYRDNSDGAVLRFKVMGEVPLGGVVMIGEWGNQAGRVGLITCAVYQPAYKRILLWFTQPPSQAYGSAVLYMSDQMHLSGRYEHGGRSGGWELMAFKE